jgi:outer membrane protein OmpA-like peptidoglycan-associated protein
MNSTTRTSTYLIAASVVAALLNACASTPTKVAGADALRARLNQLQDNPELASRAPLAIKEAQVAVSAAEQPQPDHALATHLVFIADRRILIAQATAESRLAVDQRKALLEQREAMRLDARTQEADSANRRAAAADVNAAAQQHAADQARSETAAALNQADAAKADALELQTQIDALQAKVTDRGLVLTLGDVLFASGTSSLNSAGDSHLGKLAVFLGRYKDRTVLIEGHTDSVGSDAYNLGLSQRRADAVKTYLVEQSIAASRLTAIGKGEGFPVADNGSSTGRQQNRRVEVIIENNLVSSR